MSTPKWTNTVVDKANIGKRDQYVVAFVKKVSGGVCLLCGQTAPFKDAERTPYLKIHHIDGIEMSGLIMATML